ncbi:phosphoribosyl-ATP pyrophosphatase [Chryseobacterium sp. cx-311]|uniref:phosphoribosyl-ATP pyrophosphatase n=1 Tax=Marnyiella aurantia TaxID=2758037 RepID=UPI001AEB34DD|nr:phosphoribosyl-ATP pyrophosphatase [Marnyiella aurantia]MBP0612743.1 phosphoribosyl-ATP pyrophosphatase [Marnyiella aurantia]
MGTKYSNLEELRRKKALLKKEVSEMEDLLTFDNTKESLSAFTNGFTDQFLKEETDENGEKTLAVKKEEIMRRISSGVKEQLLSRNAVLGFADSAVKAGAVEDALKLGVVALVGNYARKNLRSTSWKNKLIGAALIYLAPFALRFIRRKLVEYQKNRSVSSMEQLI